MYTGESIILYHCFQGPCIYPCWILCIAPGWWITMPPPSLLLHIAYREELSLIATGHSSTSGYLFIWGFTSLSTLYRSYHDQVVGRAEETSTYSSSGFCTVNYRTTASNYQLSHLRPCREPNPGLRGGRRECYHSATAAPSLVAIKLWRVTTWMSFPMWLQLRIQLFARRWGNLMVCNSVA